MRRGTITMAATGSDEGKRGASRYTVEKNVEELDSFELGGNLTKALGCRSRRGASKSHAFLAHPWIFQIRRSKVAKSFAPQVPQCHNLGKSSGLQASSTTSHVTSYLQLSRDATKSPATGKGQPLHSSPSVTQPLSLPAFLSSFFIFHITFLSSVIY